MAKLSFRTKAGFSCGEIGGSGLSMILGTFLAAFYTDTFGLEATAVGTLFLVTRIFDAINDPLMGTIADRTRTRWGRFRPYLLWFAPGFGIAVFALFYGPDFGPTGKLIYAYLSYNVLMTVYSAIMLPFSALSGVLTTDAKDRNSLNTFRFFTAFIVNMVLQATLKPAVAFFGQGDDTVGFRWTLLIFVLVAIPGFLIAFLCTKEPPPPKVEPPKTSPWADFGDLCRSRAWLTIVVVCIVLWIFFSIRGQVRVYYFKYFLNDDEGVSNYMALGTFFTLAGVLVTPWLTRRIDKIPLFITSLLLTAACSIAHYWVNPGDVKLLYTLQILISFVGGPFMPLIWSMMADTGDEFELTRGRPAMGLVYSASTFALKGGDALGGAASLFILGWHGFKANEVQNEHVLDALRGMMSFYPAIGFIACAGLLLFYPLNRAGLAEIERRLALRRAGTDTPPPEPPPLTGV